MKVILSTGFEGFVAQKFITVKSIKSLDNAVKLCNI